MVFSFFLSFFFFSLSKSKSSQQEWNLKGKYLVLLICQVGAAGSSQPELSEASEVQTKER